MVTKQTKRIENVIYSMHKYPRPPRVGSPVEINNWRHIDGVLHRPPLLPRSGVEPAAILAGTSFVRLNFYSKPSRGCGDFQDRALRIV
jgi:hypothetical protein